MLGGERQGKEMFVLKKGVQVKGKICSLLGDLYGNSSQGEDL
jgi:hypothetical protein